MTQEELDALPEDGGFGMKEEVIDGRTVRRVIAMPARALYQGPDEPVRVVDLQGVTWTIGWADGVRYKRRVQSLLRPLNVKE